ncbi:hypothetical protein [Streptomyces sp. DH12]|uniref:hypothetical protein n=1 Tax=Streptomyces sp. DH12 TaxID=2857010 RepID=UPI001E45D0CA|nr:hypothetical protein [Streptomyces sp. DH12]
MDLDRTPDQIARAASEEIRALNHRTLAPGAFHGDDGFRGVAPARLSSTVQGILELTQRLPQTMQQLRRGLRQLEEEQAIRMTTGRDPDEEVATALRALLNAEEAFKAAEHALRVAGAPMSAMGGYMDEEPAEDDAPVS